MRIGNVPGNLMQQVVRERQSTYTVTRVDDTANDSIGQPEEQTSEHTAELYVYDGSEDLVQFAHGEAYVGRFEALALPAADLEDGDRLMHGGHEYKIQITGLPDDQNPTLLGITMVRDPHNV